MGGSGGAVGGKWKGERIENSKWGIQGRVFKEDLFAEVFSKGEKPVNW